MRKKEYDSPRLEVIELRLTDVLNYSPPIPNQPEIGVESGFEGFDD